MLPQQPTILQLWKQNCDFHFFWSMKQALKKRRFQLNTQLEQAVRELFQQQLLEFFEKVIQRLVAEWDACLKSGGDFV
jgi:hypothetical protein